MMDKTPYTVKDRAKDLLTGTFMRATALTGELLVTPVMLVVSAYYKSWDPFNEILDISRDCRRAGNELYLLAISREPDSVDMPGTVSLLERKFPVTLEQLAETTTNKSLPSQQ